MEIRFRRHAYDRGLTGPPDADGAVQIAYSIAPSYQGKGYATEAPLALVDYALNNSRVRTIYAHMLAESNACFGKMRLQENRRVCRSGK